MSDIQDCIKYFIKKQETLTSIPHIHVYILYKVLYTFTPNKFYTYSLNVEPGNLVFLKAYNTLFH